MLHARDAFYLACRQNLKVFGIPGMSICVIGELQATGLELLPLPSTTFHYSHYRKASLYDWVKTNKIIRTAKRSDRLELISSGTAVVGQHPWQRQSGH